MLWASDHAPDIAKNPVVRWLSSHMRITKDLHGEKFFVTERDEKSGKMVRAATPLFLALVVINLADLVFAVDSACPPSSRSRPTPSSSTPPTSWRSWACARSTSRSSAMIHRFHYAQICAGAGAGVHRVKDLRFRLPAWTGTNSRRCSASA
jgi:tellurite resistance protein TerC